MKHIPQAVWDRIVSWLHTKGFAQPLILTGSQSLPWDDISVRIAQAAVCEINTANPCSTCAPCRQITVGTHPDSIGIQQTEKTIRIKDVRALLTTLTYTSTTSIRLVQLPQAHRMTRESSNALLKALEEPVSHTTRFLLTTPYPGRLLETIRSRSITIRIPQPAADPHFTANEKDRDGITDQYILDLLSPSNKQPLDDDTLVHIHRHISQRLDEYGASPDTHRMLLRLRDYYKIRSVHGNERLAAASLLATIATSRNT